MPVADKMGIDLVWFGVLLAMNLQTSFLTPPFGFSLFFLRSVAPAHAFIDRITHRRVEGVKTLDIYRGSIPFVIIQITMVATLVAFPGLVTNALNKGVKVDLDTIHIEVQSGGDWGQGGNDWGNEVPKEDGDTDMPLRGGTEEAEASPPDPGWGNPRSGW